MPAGRIFILTLKSNTLIKANYKQTYIYYIVFIGYIASLQRSFLSFTYCAIELNEDESTCFASRSRQANVVTTCLHIGKNGRTLQNRSACAAIVCL